MLPNIGKFNHFVSKAKVLNENFVRVVGGLWERWQETALLQTLDVWRLVRFANVLFCVSAFFFFVFMQQKFHCHCVGVFFLACL
ncbi:MAG: hypothetical protein WCK02_16955 [Bacteroidota bacterium]